MHLLNIEHTNVTDPVEDVRCCREAGDSDRRGETLQPNGRSACGALRCVVGGSGREVDWRASHYTHSDTCSDTSTAL